MRWKTETCTRVDRIKLPAVGEARGGGGGGDGRSCHESWGTYVRMRGWGEIGNRWGDRERERSETERGERLRQTETEVVVGGWQGEGGGRLFLLQYFFCLTSMYSE